jgi:hypothetical protein
VGGYGGSFAEADGYIWSIGYSARARASPTRSRRRRAELQGECGQPGTSTVLEPPFAPGCGRTDEERRTIAEMMVKGTYGWILLATADLDGVFARLVAGGAEVVQEPTERPYGVRDCAVRDPRAT